MSAPKLPIRFLRNLPWKHLEGKQQDEELRKAYRRVLCTSEGAIVLSSILVDLGWNRETTTPDQVALKNYSSFLLKTRLGITNDPLAAVSAIINAEVKEHER